MSYLLQAVLLGIVEGATEFIPVSSTGHLILVGRLIGFTGERAALFEIVIQLGAILAVVWTYRGTLARLAHEAATTQGWTADSRRLVRALVVAFLPAALAGFIAHRWITTLLFAPSVVALSLISGGIVMLAIERLRPAPRIEAVKDIPLSVAFGIGLAQVASLIPGVSRAATTIMGGVALGVARTAATEFSFFLAIPVMVAATGLASIESVSTLSARISRCSLSAF